MRGACSDRLGRSDHTHWSPRPLPLDGPRRDNNEILTQIIPQCRRAHGRKLLCPAAIRKSQCRQSQYLVQTLPRIPILFSSPSSRLVSTVTASTISGGGSVTPQPPPQPAASDLRRKRAQSTLTDGRAELPPDGRAHRVGNVVIFSDPERRAARNSPAPERLRALPPCRAAFQLCRCGQNRHGRHDLPGGRGRRYIQSNNQTLARICHRAEFIGFTAGWLRSAAAPQWRGPDQVQADLLQAPSLEAEDRAVL